MQALFHVLTFFFCFYRSNKNSRLLTGFMPGNTLTDQPVTKVHASPATLTTTVLLLTIESGHHGYCFTHAAHYSSYIHLASGIQGWLLLLQGPVKPTIFKSFDRAASLTLRWPSQHSGSYRISEGHVFWTFLLWMTRFYTVCPLQHCDLSVNSGNLVAGLKYAGVNAFYVLRRVPCEFKPSRKIQAFQRK